MPATAAALSGLCDRIVVKRRSAASSSPARSQDLSDSTPRCISSASEYGAARAYSCASDGAEATDHQPPAASNTVSAAAHASRCWRDDKAGLADGAGAAAGDAAEAGVRPEASDAADASVVDAANPDVAGSVSVVSAASAAIRSPASPMLARRCSTLAAVMAWISRTHAGARLAGNGHASDDDWMCAAASASPLKWANGRVPVSSSYRITPSA